MNNSSFISGNKILIFALSVIPLLLHLYTNIFTGYGIFRDELYYIACTDHLASGYVDHPPFSIYVLKLVTLIFGDSVFSIRLLPAINSALTVFMTCLMTLRLGGKKTALVISSIVVIFAPVYLAMNGFYSMNSIDILLWSMAFYFIILIIENNKTSNWIILGLVFGVGLLNKIGFLWLGFGFFVGILISENRKVLLTIKPYLCALIALLIFSPFVIWNFNNDLAHIEFIRNASSGKYSGLDAGDFIKGQIMNMNPASLIIWLLGLYYFLFDNSGKKFRILGIIYLSAFIILILNTHSKSVYLSPAYTALFAGGGVFIERITSLRFKWLRYAVILPVVMIGIFAAPLALPVLPVESYIKYAERSGFTPSTSENKELSELPQHYADMFGWEELAKNVSDVYLTIPEIERDRVLFFGNNYGEAGAIDYFRNKYPLPKAISTHNSYYLWRYGIIDEPIVILLGGKKEDYINIFEDVKEVTIHTAKYSMPYENNLPVFIAKDLKINIKDIWEKNKNYD